MKKFLLALTALGLMSVAQAGDITDTGLSQGDLVKLLTNMVRHEQNHVVDSANIGISLFNTANVTLGVTGDAIQYVSSGNFARLAVSNDIVLDGLTPTPSSQATATIRDYLISYIPSGDVYSYLAGDAQSRTEDVKLPAVPSGGVPLGVIRINTGTTTYIAGAGPLDSNDMTISYRDLYVPTTGPSAVSTTGL